MSPYSIHPIGHDRYAIHHDRIGPVPGYSDIASYGDAEAWIVELEDADAETAAQKAADQVADEVESVQREAA